MEGLVGGSTGEEYWKGGKEICLICNCLCDSEGTNGLSGSLSLSSGILGKDLNVYFILRHVLELPTERMEYFLEHCDCRDPVGEWVKICGTCLENYVDKCRKIFEELIEVKRRFVEARMELIGMIKGSVEMETREEGNCMKEQIRKETRQFARLHEYRNSGDIINSLTAGDEMAREKDVSSKRTQGKEGTDKNGDLENTTPTFHMNLKEEPELQMSDTSDNEGWEPKHEPTFFSERIAEKEDDENWEQKNVKSSFPSRIAKMGEDQDWDADTGRESDLEVEDSIDDTKRLDKQRTSQRKPAKIRKAKRISKTSESKLQARTCPFCNKVLSTKSKVKRHINSAHNDNREKFPCQHCSKVFCNKPSLFNHLGSAHGIKDHLRFTCSYEGCDRAFFKRCDLLDHEAEIHSDSPPKYKCTMCKQAFKSNRLLRAHQLKHQNQPEGLRPFLCELCPAKYRTKSGLREHMKTYHATTKTEEGRTRKRKEPQNYKCSECDGDFHNFKGLQRHLESVHGVIKSIEELRGVQTYQCSQCGVILCDKPTLTKHIRGQHERTLQVCCEICGKVLSNLECLKSHMYRLHKIGEIDMNKYPCTVEGCSKAFQHASELKMHILAKHERKRIYKCKFCGKDFFSSSNRRTHITALHVNSGRKPFSCGECGKAFAIKGYLWQHQRTHHRAAERASTSIVPVLFLVA